MREKNALKPPFWHKVGLAWHTLLCRRSQECGSTYGMSVCAAGHFVYTCMGCGRRFQ